MFTSLELNRATEIHIEQIFSRLSTADREEVPSAWNDCEFHIGIRNGWLQMTQGSKDFCLAARIAWRGAKLFWSDTSACAPPFRSSFRFAIRCRRTSKDAATRCNRFLTFRCILVSRAGDSNRFYTGSKEILISYLTAARSTAITWSSPAIRCYFVLPSLTEEGHRVTIFRLRDTSIDNFSIQAITKRVLMVLDMRLMEERCLSNVMVVDLEVPFL